jgi:hypothetical protein
MHSTNPFKVRQGLRQLIAGACLLGSTLLSMQLYGGSSPLWTSAASFGGSGSDIGQAVKVDGSGNRYVTGAFSATASFPLRATEVDGAAGTAHKTLTSAGGTDIFVAKYDSSGTLSWLVQAGGSGDDSGFDIAFDAESNVYVTGMFTDSATFHGTNGTEKVVTGVGETIFLVKYLPSGMIAWIRTGITAFDSSNNGYGVAIEPVTGSVYVAGVSQGNTTFSSANGTTHSVAGPETWHMVLVKYDTAGNFHWGESNQAEVNSVAHKVAVDSQNNVYATGWMEGQTTFYSHDGQNVTVNAFSGPIQSAPDYPCDAFIVQYDANGNVKWGNHIGGYKAIGTDIATSRDGKVSITGFIGNIANSPEQAATIVTSQPGGSNVNLGGGTLTSPFNRDVLVVTYNSAGVVLAARRFGGPQDDGGSGIIYDARNNMIVAGIFQNSITIQGQPLSGKDTYSFFVANLGCGAVSINKDGCTGGSLLWARAADGPGIAGFENDPRIGATADGDVLVTGAYEPSAQSDGLKLESAGEADGFLALLHAGKP